ncbi:MAG: hypothetical protein GY913_30575 [Proteobacteria bacterium]|nr:hypothetical protein [Pseudomonadota bacterium]
MGEAAWDLRIASSVGLPEDWNVIGGGIATARFVDTDGDLQVTLADRPQVAVDGDPGLDLATGSIALVDVSTGSVESLYFRGSPHVTAARTETGVGTALVVSHIESWGNALSLVEHGTEPSSYGAFSTGAAPNTDQAWVTDLEGDGAPEVLYRGWSIGLASDEAARQVLAFEMHGKGTFISADLDLDGQQEMLVSDSGQELVLVLDAVGEVLAESSPAALFSHGSGDLPMAVANLDDDVEGEFVVGGLTRGAIRPSRT